MTKGEETREMIVRQAAGLFNVKGYHGASLSDVMRVTGLQKGGLYNHFESKEQLAIEAFDYAVKLITERYISALAGKSHSVDRLVAIIDVFTASVQNPVVAGGC